MELSHFTVKGTWEGDRNGVGKIQSSSGITIEASVPREFDGPGVGFNPEELLTSSANNCYMITLAAMLSNRKIGVAGLEVVSEGVVEKVEGKLRFKQIIHKPIISISADSEITAEKLEELAVRAEKACFISNTLRNSIEFSVEAKVNKI